MDDNKWLRVFEFKVMLEVNEVKIESLVLVKIVVVSICIFVF